MSTILANVESAVEGAVKAVEGAPAAEVKALEAEIKTVEISVEEKLNIRNLENEFLKANLEINNLQKRISQIQSQFPAYVESLYKKYKVDVKKFNFNAITQVFEKL